MITTFDAILPATQLNASATPHRGRVVPVDAIAEPEDRPRYPRLIAPVVRELAPTRVTQVPNFIPAQAARYRARVARAACEAREAKLAARHATAKVGGR